APRRCSRRRGWPSGRGRLEVDLLRPRCGELPLGPSVPDRWPYRASPGHCDTRPTMIHVDSGAVDAFLEELWQRKGTDLLLTVGVPPLLRIDGSMLPADGAEVLDAERIEAIVMSLL